MGISGRKQRQSEAVKATILSQSWQIVEENGWQALSIRKIADAIEYSTQMVYTHFESKDAIIEEFTKQGFDLLAAQLQKAAKSKEDPSEQLVAISKAYWKFAFEHIKYYQIMFGLGIPTCEMVSSFDEMKKVSDVMGASIDLVIRSGKNPEADGMLKLGTFWSVLHGLVAIEMISAKGYSDYAERILDDAVSGFIKALTH